MFDFNENLKRQEMKPVSPNANISLLSIKVHQHRSQHVLTIGQFV